MLELFRKNYFFNSLLLLPYTFLLGIDTLIKSQPIQLEGTTHFYKFCFSWLQEMPILCAVLAILLLFFEAAMINRILIKHRLSRISSLLPGVVYILLMNSIPGLRGFNEVLVANFFVLLFLSESLLIVRRFRTEILIFDMGIWVGLSSLLYPNYLFLWGIVIFSILILRAFSLKEILQAFVGYITILFLASTLFYFRGDFYEFITDAYQFKVSNVFYALDFSNIHSTIILVIAYFLVAFSVFNYYGYQAKQTIKEHKKIDLLFWTMAFALIGLFFNDSLQVNGLLTLSIPLACFIGMFLSNWKQKLLAEIIHLCVLIGLMFLHLQIIF